MDIAGDVASVWTTYEQLAAGRRMARATPRGLSRRYRGQSTRECTAFPTLPRRVPDWLPESPVQSPRW
jgi:hypothetical protein